MSSSNVSSNTSTSVWLWVGGIVTLLVFVAVLAYFLMNKKNSGLNMAPRVPNVAPASTTNVNSGGGNGVGRTNL